MSRFFVVGVALLLAAGCNHRDGAASAGPIPLEGICGVYIDDLCTALVQCTDSIYLNVEECRADHMCVGFTGLKEEIAGGWTVYSPEGAGRCHQQVRADPCAFAKRFTFVPGLPTVLTGCSDALVGKRAVGETCIGDRSCVPGSFCPPGSECQGVCKPFLQLGEGPCFATDARCAPDLECHADACRVRATKAGDPCMMPGDCVGADLWCDETTNVCARLRGEGEPCNLFGAGCLAPLHCDADPAAGGDGVCRPPSSVGARCLTVIDCVPEAICINQQCVARRGPGQACAISRECVDGTECIGATCQRQQHLGDTCGGPGSCVVGKCQDGTCVPAGPAGSSCTSITDCLSRGCAQGTCKDLTPCWEVIHGSGMP